MHLIARGRQEGKTTLLFEWLSKDPNRILLSVFYDNTDTAWNRYKLDHGILSEGKQVYDYRNFASQRRGSMVGEIAIDDAEFLMQQMTGGYRISAISITADTVDVEDKRRWPSPEMFIEIEKDLQLIKEAGDNDTPN